MLIAVLFSFFFTQGSEGEKDYINYHKKVIQIEESIAKEDYKSALDGYQELFSEYDFIFLRDYKVATQLALYLNYEATAYQFLKSGIKSGWKWKEITKNKFLKPLWKGVYADELKSKYTNLNKTYKKSIDLNLRSEVHEMFKKDQKKALGALLRVGDKAQNKYGEKKFGPHSNKQLLMLNKLIDKNGYPGEKRIGNNYWASTILAHHNSITKEFIEKDKLYPQIKPKLINALKNGEMSPYEYATIEDWRIAVLKDEPFYGYVREITESSLGTINKNRNTIGLRPIELRYKLINTQKKTGINFYLPRL